MSISVFVLFYVKFFNSYNKIVKKKRDTMTTVETDTKKITSTYTRKITHTIKHF